MANTMSNGATREIFMSEALREAIDEEMQRDPTVFLVGEEIGVWGGSYAVSAGLLEKYGPDRIVDTPIAEAAKVLIGPALIALTLIFFSPKSLARYFTLVSSADLQTPITL